MPCRPRPSSRTRSKAFRLSGNGSKNASRFVRNLSSGSSETLPPQPDNLRGVITGTEADGKLSIRDIRLEFGPDRRGTLRIQLIVPPGNGPFPVFLTDHPRTWPWVATAVRRGYMGCIYFAGDPIFGPADDSDRFIDVYPECDFSCMGRWAWAGMRAIDYLQTLPEVDKHKIAIAGHSRNGKQALLAAAFDDRIAAVIASSGNTGECDPWRYSTEMFVNESLEQITGVLSALVSPASPFLRGPGAQASRRPTCIDVLGRAARALYVLGVHGGRRESFRHGTRLFVCREGLSISWPRR